MRIELNINDQNKVKEIVDIRDMNAKVLGMYASILNEHSCFITKELIYDITNDCNVSEEYAYVVLLAAVCGLDMEHNKKDMQIATSYFTPSIKKLDTKSYRENPYYKNIKIPEVKFGDWELKYETYQPYEAFIYNDIIVDKYYREIPRLGFFDEEFLHPAVLESGTPWMTITPNEIETMQPVVDVVEGKVITFGLGLGYFTYMVSEKEQVQSITVVEKNEKIINLFHKYILPQFPHKEKVEIISMDAFEYARNYLPKEQYDYAFVDLWHDVSDGVGLYQKMKKLEYLSPNTKYLYWIEESILSNLRYYVFIVLIDEIENRNYDYEDINTSSQDEFERKYRAVSSYLKDENINSFDQITYYLSNSFLRKLATEIVD